MRILYPSTAEQKWWRKIFLPVVGATMADSRIFLQDITVVVQINKVLFYNSCSLEKSKINNCEIVKDESMHSGMPNTTTRVLVSTRSDNHRPVQGPKLHYIPRSQMLQSYSSKSMLEDQFTHF